MTTAQVAGRGCSDFAEERGEITKLRKRVDEMKRAVRAKLIAKWVKKVKEMPGLTDQARSIALKFWDHFGNGSNILDDLQLMKPRARCVLDTGTPSFQKLRSKLKQYAEPFHNI